MKNTYIPNHIAIIPDGNRRWAAERGESAAYGHQKGAEAFQDITRYAADQGVKHFSSWGMSLNNLKKRSLPEVKALLKIFQEQFQYLIDSKEIHDRQVKVNVIGRWREKFPASLIKTIDESMAATKDYTQSYLNFFLAYNGTDEMIQAVQSIVNSKDDNKKITADTIKENLLTKDLPPVDLLVRTGGEPHLSTGFMMWDTADAELYFTPKYWPDFSRDEFDLALGDYASRRRKKGK